MMVSRRRAGGFLGALTYVLAALTLAAPLAAAAPAPPEELQFQRQKDFSFKGAEVGLSEFPVPGAEKTTAPTVLGSITNGSGDLAKVTLDQGTVSIEPVDAPGKYSGKVNLVPSNEKGEKTKITFEVRDNVIWAAVFLIIGLILALFSELWLTRWRPRGQLRKKLNRIANRLDATAAQQSQRLNAARSGWAAPRIQGEGSLLVILRERIESGLEGAMSDEERKRFGPEGDEMKKVDTLVESYEELLSYGAQIAQGFTALSRELDSGSTRQEFESGALVKRTTDLLKSKAISTGPELTGLVAEAKEIHTVLHATARLDEGYRFLAKKPGTGQGMLKQIEARRLQLLHNDATADDIKAQQAIYAEMAKKLYGGEEPQVVQMTVPRLGSLSLGGPAPAPAAPPTLTPGATEPEAAPIVSTLPEQGGAWSRYFDLGNYAFSVISGAIVVVGGLSALYFSNTTFGSFGDYLGLVLWGSTIQGGISLVRRLLPGGVTGLTAGGSSS